MTIYLVKWIGPSWVKWLNVACLCYELQLNTSVWEKLKPKLYCRFPALTSGGWYWSLGFYRSVQILSLQWLLCYRQERAVVLILSDSLVILWGKGNVLNIHYYSCYLTLSLMIVALVFNKPCNCISENRAVIKPIHILL